MTTQQTASRFKTTSWTIVARSADGGPGLETLVARYWSPVYAFLRRKGHDREDAADLTQGFLTDIVLERDLPARADRSRGRFRSFLLTALKNYVIDERRRTAGRPPPDKPEQRRRVVLVPGDAAILDAAEPDEADDPIPAFERQWATTILSRALKTVEEACLEAGMDRQWTAFEARVLRPLVHGGESLPVESLVESLGVDDRQVVYDMVQTVKRKLDPAVREAVAETVEVSGDVEAELVALREILAR